MNIECALRFAYLKNAAELSPSTQIKTHLPITMVKIVTFVASLSRQIKVKWYITGYLREDQLEFSGELF